ncbi:IclR family transcriptional regulator [Actibacterium sp. 188UL27-1]|uniref:IclR family transcriptional regulator n=1 Tax=Actibacterium sp. 188UL27-1 TaxID=2786961 RepID=UPI00195EB9CA|nr:IclR family transcriptional regulator [Actibacterium sp. 188UL27-1]MBM7069641.1 IclR family transcriptional regulator [Actibacterium sp. 188UL27-1]
MDDGVDAKDRNFVSALARGLDVLSCFRPNETVLSNQDIAARTGLPKPTVSRLTYTLCKLDYLALDPRTRTYRLSAGVLSLGFGVLSGLPVTDRAAVTMRSLCDTGPNRYVTCALAERHRFDMIYVAVQRSTEDVSLTMSVGSRLPLFFSAIGRAVLVAMDAADRDAIFNAAREADPSGFDRIKASFDKARADHETLGYCRGFGDWREDVNGIAVPVRALGSSAIYGLNIGGPAFHVTADELEARYAAPLQEAARVISMSPGQGTT